jgi:dienelactone hydrolase
MAVALLGAAAIVPSALSGQSTGQTAFVFLMSGDTVGIERFSASPQLVTGEILQRGQPRLTYLATKAAPGRFASLDLVAYPPNAAPDAEPLQRVRLRIVGDSAIADITAGGAGAATTTQKFATKADALMIINNSVAMFEPVLELMTGAHRDSVTVHMLFVAGGQTLPATFRRVTADSIEVRLGPQQNYLVVRGTAIVRVYAPAQRLVMQRIEGDAAARIALGKPDYSAPAGAPYRAENVRVPTPAGHAMAGTLTMPTGVSGRVPAVVTITGSGPQDRDEYLPIVPGYRPFRQVADTLGRRGIAVLRMDDRGTGESGGNHATATSADFADDIRAGIAWLRARPDIDPARIAVLGHSEGGLIAPIIAASDPRLAAAVLLAGPSTRGREILDFQLRYGIDHDTAIAPGKRDSAFKATRAGFDSTAGKQPWMRYFQEYDPIPTIRKVKQPVLILQGATDQQVTAEQAEIIAREMRATGNRAVTVRVYPDRNHLFLPDTSGNPAGYTRLTSGKIGPEIMGQIADWLANVFKR